MMKVAQVGVHVLAFGDVGRDTEAATRMVESMTMGSIVSTITGEFHPVDGAVLSAVVPMEGHADWSPVVGKALRTPKVGVTRNLQAPSGRIYKVYYANEVDPKEHENFVLQAAWGGEFIKGSVIVVRDYEAEAKCPQAQSARLRQIAEGIHEEPENIRPGGANN